MTDNVIFFRFLSVVENYLANVDINPGSNVRQNEGNIAVYSQNVNQSSFDGASAESLFDPEIMEDENDFVVSNNDLSAQPATSRISLTMPKSLFTNLKIDSSDKNQRIFFVIYREQTFFHSFVNKSTDRKTVNKLNSWVISGSIKGKKLANMTDPIVTTYKPLENGIHEKTACVFWEFSLKNGNGDWSQTGCTYKGMKDGIVTCHCSHLTNFAILVVRKPCYVKNPRAPSSLHCLIRLS